MITRAQLSAAAKYAEGHTDLMRLALEGHTGTVKALLRKGADVNARDPEGRTALMFAVINMHAGTVKTLLEHGTDVNVKANDGGTSLMLAASSGDIEIVRALLGKGADVSGKYTQTGKTALMLAEERGYTGIVELLKPDEGRVFVDGEDITACSEAEMEHVREKIGMVFQEGALFDSLSVYDNVAFKLHERDMPEEDVEREVRLLLRFVGLEDEMDKMRIELSGGMQKRVGVARALVGDPKIVLFDEPTAGLDLPTARTIGELIIKLRDLEDVSSILVTHEMGTVGYVTSEYATVNDTGEVTVEEDGE